MSRIGLLFASGDARDAEILALRHQILVLQRQIGRPLLTNSDRTILAVLHSSMDRARTRTAFLIVKPEAVLRWNCSARSAPYPNHVAGANVIYSTAFNPKGHKS